MATQLTGSAQSVTLGGGYAVRAPGLKGTAQALPPGGATTRTVTRSLAAGMVALDSALQAEAVTEVKVIDLLLQPAPRTSATNALRSAQGGQVELEVPALGDDVGQLVVSIDDAGAVRWHLPEPKTSGAKTATRGAAGTLRFRIPATTATPAIRPGTPSGSRQRSLFGAAGRLLLKVLVYPVTDPLIGSIGDAFARRWEERKRPYRLRSFTPENYQNADVSPMSADELAKVCAEGPVLMFVHGTFSTAHAGFGGLAADTLAELYRHYGARVVAFDHPTLADSPVDNARWIAAQLPTSGVRLDVICHSRGGLVARVLAERHAPFALNASGVDVRRIVFAGVPNSGTVLVDPDHMVNMVDRLTTVLTLAPAGPVAETLEALVIVIKMVGHGALKGLQGLVSMHPAGPFLSTLNHAGGRLADYFAVTSNYEPTDEGLRGLVLGVADNLVDYVFGDAENDLVVPTDGVWARNGGAGFPLREDRVFTLDPSFGGTHTNLFPHQAVADKLLEWLTQP
jgi:pimeloyl-ACP methyl ester carboxylesterase